MRSLMLTFLLVISAASAQTPAIGSAKPATSEAPKKVITLKVDQLPNSPPLTQRTWPLRSNFVSTSLSFTSATPLVGECHAYKIGIAKKKYKDGIAGKERINLSPDSK